MLERIADLPAALSGVRATGWVTGRDYGEVLEPLIAEARQEGRRVRLLYHLAPSFESFTPGALFADLLLGARHGADFERCAAVTDHAGPRRLLRAARVVAPCPLRIFHDAQWDEAVAWLGAPPTPRAFRCRLLEDRAVLLVEPAGKLDVEAFEALDAAAGPWLDAGHELAGVVVHAREFPGWRTFGAFLRHLGFIRAHRRQVRRIAVCVDGKIAKLAPAVVETFVPAEIRHFGSADLDRGIEWAGGGPAQLAPP